MSNIHAAHRVALSALAATALTLAGCSGAPADNQAAAKNETVAKEEEGEIDLSPEQIKAAGITLVQPLAGGPGGAITAPALLEGDPEATRVVSAPIGGRITSLTRNIGEYVRAGETLAVIQSREAATLNADVEGARARAKLTRSNLARDEALAERGFLTKRNLDASRAANEEAEVNLRNAEGQVSAAGIRGGGINRIVITAPISGQIVARNAVLGQIFSAEAAGAELFRIVNLSRLSVALSLSPADAARVKIGGTVEITAAGDRRQAARISYISPVLDEGTRLVRILASLDNKGGMWRAGEPVQAAVQVAAPAGATVFSIPATAVQTIEGKPSVFVRSDHGFRVVPIILGPGSGDMVAVTAGLTGKEQIANANSFVLKAELGKGEAGHGH